MKIEPGIYLKRTARALAFVPLVIVLFACSACDLLIAIRYWTLDREWLEELRELWADTFEEFRKWVTE